MDYKGLEDLQQAIVKFAEINDADILQLKQRLTFDVPTVQGEQYQFDVTINIDAAKCTDPDINVKTIRMVTR